MVVIDVREQARAFLLKDVGVVLNRKLGFGMALLAVEQRQFVDEIIERGPRL
jgi:hypothetical protein